MKSKQLFRISILTASLSIFAAEDKPRKLPWSGRFANLSLDNLKDAYLLHILTQCPRKDNCKVSDYVTLNSVKIDSQFNDDSGSCSISVDGEARFQDQRNIIRAELVQKLEIPPKRGMRLKFAFVVKEAFKNKLDYQVAFLESHQVEVRIEQSSGNPEVRILNTTNPDMFVWRESFKVGTYYKFDILCSPEMMEYHVGIDDKKVTTIRREDIKFNPKLKGANEFHIGLLSYSSDPEHPPMNGRDTIVFNGVSAEAA
uniref:Uncharacterized protein AlNc14C3G495 n=1 Tax=Albugo laibachii Nc14 TaxID=890382 RepID=F0W017_9STRA|nr:conserved hypothetical protein [Albugo laibachii Nc14]|eukprot:CCA14388.1 conserved hypothetical protein [Albugo laibachii Nc14]